MYTKSITRSSRTLFVITIDQSCSMAGEVCVGERVITKAQMVADAANDLISELIERARRSDGVRDYYDVAIVGYSGDGAKILLPQRWLSITELDNNCISESDISHQYIFADGQKKIVKHHSRQWITPKASGSTPMYEALLLIYDLIDEWVQLPQNRDSFPPIVNNITDGESSDCGYSDIAEASARIKSLSTNDGQTLLFNIHIASAGRAKPILLPTPSQMASWADSPRAAQALYHASSDIPPIFNAAVSQIKGSDPSDSYKAMSFNASISEIITILNIGSTSVRRE